MKKIKYCVSVFIAIVFFIPQVIVYGDVSTSESEATDFLLSIGMPQEVIDSLTEAKRHELFTSMSESEVEDITFDSFGVTIKYEDTVERFRNRNIPRSDLRIAIVAANGILQGQPVTLIYPSFSWQVARNLRDDGFTMSLGPGWQTMGFVGGSNPNLRLWAVDTRNGNRHTFSDHGAVSSGGVGYGFRFNTGSTMGGIFRFEGFASLIAVNYREGADRGINLKYTHNTSTGLSPSLSGTRSIINMSGNFTF